MLKSNSISADSTFYILSYFVFFKITYDFLMNISFEYVLLVVVCVYGYFFIVDRLIVFGSWLILVSYIFLTIACVWKLEIKVLLYLPVSQPPTVTMVLVSIKKKVLVLSVYAVLLRYITHRSVFMHDVISQANRCSWVEQIETMREQRNWIWINLRFNN